MITSALPTNWSTALNGKVAGLSVISSGGPLNSSRISLRGDVSLNQNGNDALVVVDGVPMSSPMTNPGVAYGAGSNSELSVDYGNGFSDINPDDIESIQVLKRSQCDSLVRYACSQWRDYGDYQIGSRCTQRYRCVLQR